MRSEEKVLKSSRSKVETLEIPIPNEKSLQGTPFHLPSITMKAIDHESHNFNAKKSRNTFDEEDE